jgi:transposase
VEVKNKIMEQKYFIGVDVSKDKLDCAIILSNFSVVREKVVKNNDLKIASFLRAVVRKFKLNDSDILVCCESTGIYNRPLERVCSDLGIPLWVEQALKIKRASTDMRGKSDRKDAIRIAEYAVRYQDRKVLFKKPSDIVEKLNNLSKVRETLLGQKVAIENQLREAKTHDPKSHKELLALYRPCLRVIANQLKKVEIDINTCVEEQSDLKKNIELIQSIPGVGKQVALQFLISTNNFTDFESAKHLACYAGVVPFANESGTIVKRPRISKMANMKLKCLLHLAAMAAIRTKTDLQTYYIRKVAEGKNKMSVINAVRNKLVHRIWAVIQRQTPYTPQRENLSN